MAENDDEKVVYFGETDSRNRRLRFGIKKKDRSRHLYAIGKTGMGKSTLLENLAIQDIQNGDGVCFIDPHGKSADFLLDYVPEHRIKDVVYFAPFDMEYPVSFNVMEDVGPEQRYLVASGMMSAFKKIWVDAWSARMEYILGNIMLALLEYPGSTLVAVNRMLTDKDFRKEVVNHISDPSVKSFWVNEYANYTEKFAAEAAPAIQNKVGQFVANPLIRNIIGQPKSSFDIREIMDNKKILIINLSKGRVGEANANLLGSMLITKIYLGAMSRADLSLSQLEAAPNFYLYVDEFQSFANESFADILSEARKYKLNLHIAHQYIEQMTDEVRAAVFGNVGTMCIYRVGAYDAEVLEKEFAPQFTAEDIVNLQKYQMYLKLMIDGVTSPPFSASGMSPIPRPEISYTKEIIDSSRALYARPRAQVEQELLEWIQTQFGGGGGNSKGGQSGGSAFGPGAGQSKGGGQGGFDRGGQNGGQGGNRNGSDQGGGQRPDRRDGGRDMSRGDNGRGGSSGREGSNSTQRDNRDNPRSQGSGGASTGGASVGGTGNGNAPQRRSQGDIQGGGSNFRGNSNGRRENGRENAERNDRAFAREDELRKAMSLSYLKPEVEEDKKTPKPENLAALREALLTVMNSTGITTEQSNTNIAEVTNPEPLAPQSESTITVTAKSNVPEVPISEPAPVPAAPIAPQIERVEAKTERTPIEPVQPNRNQNTQQNNRNHGNNNGNQNRREDRKEGNLHHPQKQVQHDRSHAEVRTQVQNSIGQKAPQTKDTKEVGEDVLKDLFQD